MITYLHRILLHRALEATKSIHEKAVGNWWQLQAGRPRGGRPALNCHKSGQFFVTNFIRQSGTSTQKGNAKWQQSRPAKLLHAIFPSFVWKLHCQPTCLRYKHTKNHLGRAIKGSLHPSIKTHHFGEKKSSSKM